MPTENDTISEARKRSNAKYAASPKGMESGRRRSLRYARTPHGKAKLDARRLEHRARLNAIKLDRGCIDCGYRRHPAALEFDHLPGFEKSFTIGNIRAAWERVEAEIAKCEVVCANCHAIRTEERKRGNT
jgi:hypothetical protein